MVQNIQIFNHELFGKVRTMTNEKSETFFVGKDVAKALGYKNPSNALQVHVDSEDKTSYLIQVSGSTYKANTLFINESGLYCLTTTEIADTLGMTTKDLNLQLVKLGVQFRKEGRYKLEGQYEHLGYAQDRSFHYYGLNGEKKERKYLVWTKQGRKFIEEMICMN